MSNVFLEELKKYEVTTVNGQELAASELLQKVILAGLSETDFFERASLFAGKAHALLCRDYGEYVKGRDWYDFLWYMNKKAEPNYRYLSDVLNRNGPWRGQNITVTRNWFEKALKEKIDSLNMEMVKKDVIRFVNPKERDMVNTWTKDTFLAPWQNCT